MRRNNGDRRSHSQDEDLSQSVSRAIRPVLTTLGQELSMCVRYNNVTFRGTPISRFVLGGGEANQGLVEVLNSCMVDEFILSEPFRDDHPPSNGPPAQWDIAVGLAYRHAIDEQVVTA